MRTVKDELHDKYYCPICGRRLVEVAYGHFSENMKRIVGQQYAHTRDFQDCPIKCAFINTDIDVHPTKSQVPLVAMIDYRKVK